MSDVIRTPSWRAAFVEQVRMVGLSLRGEALVVLVLVGCLSVGLGVSIVREGAIFHIRPENFVLLGVLAAVFPFVVWKGRERLDESILLTQPVEHRRHVLTRALAGWVWAMVAVAFVLAWLSALVLLSEGTFANPLPTRWIVVGPAARPSVDMPSIYALESLREVRWTQPLWLWLVPFTSATIAYAMLTAVNLAARHPVRLVGGVIVAILLLGLATGEYVFEWLRIGLHYVLVHPWGLDTVMTGGTESLKAQGEVTINGLVGVGTVWRELPTFAAYAGATLLWSAIAAAALWAATLRFREANTKSQ